MKEKELDPPEYEILLINLRFQLADWYYLDVGGVINDRK